MLLAVDVGNSNIVLGGYIDGRLCFTARFATDRQMEADQYAVQLRGLLALNGFLDHPVKSVMMASVVPNVSQMLERALGYFTAQPVRLMTLEDAGGVEVAIDRPAELGMDILATAVAVRHRWPLPAVIIDMGTATKLTALDEKGRLLGVAISPGLFLSLNAMINGASQLQGIQLGAPPAAIGTNSAASIKSGVIFGNAAMIDGMTERFASEMGGVKSVIGTGGAAPLVLPHCRRNIELCEMLLLDGLEIASRRKTG